MAKKNPETNPVEDSPYINEAPKAKKSLKDIASSRGAKIGAIVAGSTLALGAAFGIGLTAGHLQGPAFGHGQLGQGHPDRDGDHGKGGKSGHFDGRDGHRDGDRSGKFQMPVDPNAQVAPAPTAP